MKQKGGIKFWHRAVAFVLGYLAAGIITFTLLEIFAYLTGMLPAATRSEAFFLDVVKNAISRIAPIGVWIFVYVQCIRRIRRKIASNLITVGDVRMQAGDRSGALAAYQEGLDIDRKLAGQVRQSVSAGLNKLEDKRLQEGSQAGAFADNRAGLDIAAKLLAAQEQGDARAQAQVIFNLYKMSAAVDPEAGRTALTEALAILGKLDRERTITTAERIWQTTRSRFDAIKRSFLFGVGSFLIFAGVGALVSPSFSVDLDELVAFVAVHRSMVDITALYSQRSRPEGRGAVLLKTR